VSVKQHIQTNRLLGKAPLIVEVMLTLLLVWVISGWVMPDNDVQADVVVEASEPVAVQLPDVEALVAVALFGEAPPEPVKPQVIAQPMILAPLNIVLLGTIVADEAGAAIVKLLSSPDQKVFFVGDTIQFGVKLKKVESERITVERAGKLEKVALDNSTKLSSSPMLDTIQPQRPPGRAMYPSSHASGMPH